MLFAALLQPGCAARRTDVAPHYVVYDGREVAMRITDRPGPIRSAVDFPRASEEALHPFLSISFPVIDHETEVMDLLRQTTSTKDFLRSLEERGFRVKRRGRL